MIKRGTTHVTDTLAVRAIFSELPADWLVRSLDERDYGIDLSIEMFSGDEPTGKVAFIQVKGRDACFDEKVWISFPVKTIQYALLFAEPFFLFHTSIKDRQTYFLWVQKYVTAKLNLENPDWQTQEHVTLHFPFENTLKDGRAKIERIMAKIAARIQAIEYLSAFDWLADHWQALMHGESDLIEPCIRNLERMQQCDRFLEVYAEFDQFRPDFVGAKGILVELGVKLKSPDSADPEVDSLVEAFEAQLGLMQLVKKGFLDEDQLDQIAAEISDPPY